MNDLYNKMFLLCVGLLFSYSVISAQTVVTVNTLNDTPPWDNPDTPEDETDDGICMDKDGHCSLRAALTETKDGNLFARTINIVVEGQINLNYDPLPLTLADGFKIFGNANIKINQTAENSICFQIAGSECGLENLQLTAPTGTGVYILGTNNIKIKNCRIKDNFLNGIQIVSGQNIEISDNVISGNKLNGISIEGFNISDVKIKRNKIGTNDNATSADGNLISGISVAYSTFPLSNILIGGDNPSDRNIISGNNNGIQILADNIIVKNNYIGTNYNGTVAIPDSLKGIVINSKNNTICNNVISGNSLYGIMLHNGIFSSASSNKIFGNIIGGTATDTLPLPNLVGIWIAGYSTDNIIGAGLNKDNTQNAIVYNSLYGIYVDSSVAGSKPVRNTFRKNLYKDNNRLAIKVTLNTQNNIKAPLIDSIATDSSGDVFFYGHEANPNATVDMYKCDPASLTEGKDWISEDKADVLGNFKIKIDDVSCDALTVMQTDLNGNSSQFAKSISPAPLPGKIEPNCTGPFIVGITYDNEFTIKINWNGIPEPSRKVTFFLNGVNQKDGILNDDIAKVTYDMGILTKGNNEISCQVFGCSPTPLSGQSCTLCAVDLPTWLLSPAAYCDNGQIHYKEKILFPASTIANVLDIPSYVAFIAGALEFAGIPEYEVEINMPGVSPNVEFNKQFSFLGTALNFTTTGNVTSTLDCSGIVPVGNIGMHAGITHTFHAGFNLESYLPDCTGIFSFWILEDICQYAHSLARSIRASATVGGSIDINSRIVLNNSLSLTGTGTAKAFVKPEFDLFFFHARGNGEISFTLSLPTFELVNFQYQLSGHIYCSTPIPALDFDIPLGPWPRTGIQFASLNERILSDVGFKNQTNEMKYFHVENSYSRFTLSDTVVAEKIPNDAEVKFCAGKNNYEAVVWNEFNSSSERPSGDIALKIKNGTVWSNNIILNNDINIDQNPMAVFDANNNIVLCWERNFSPTIPSGEELYNPIFLKKYEIAYAVVDPSNGNIIQSGSLGDSLHYDFNPLLMKGKDGTIMLIWQATNGNTLFGKPGNELLLNTVEWNGNNWDVVKIISNTLEGVMNWDGAVYSSDKAMLALIKDNDNDFSTSTDREVQVYNLNGENWTGPIYVTSDNTVDWAVHTAYTNDGNPLLCWQKDTLIVGLTNDLNSTPSVWLDSSDVGLEFMNADFMCTSEDSLILIWKDGSAIFYSFADLENFDWCENIPIKTTPEVQRSVTTYFNSDGNLLIGYLQFPRADSLPEVNSNGKIFISEIDLKNIVTGSVEELKNIPHYFKLYSAYPNPFNTSTKIKFEIPAVETGQASSLMTTLKVYDILGREVATLVNETKEAGTHEVEFDGSNLTSGIYFYRLQAGSFSEVKKLILMK